MLEQVQHPRAQRVGRGLVPGDDEDDHHGDELVVAEAVAAVGGLHEGRQEVVPGLGTPLGGELDHEVGRRAEGPVGLGHRLGAGGGLVHGDERVGDGDRRRRVLVPDAEHVEDHLGRQHLGHVGEQVDLGATGRRRRAGARQTPSTADAQPLRSPPREDRAHEAPQPGVARRRPSSAPSGPSPMTRSRRGAAPGADALAALTLHAGSPRMMAVARS